MMRYEVWSGKKPEMSPPVKRVTIMPTISFGMNAENGTVVGPRLSARKNAQKSIAPRRVMILTVRIREVSGIRILW
jgi:hypothetical protein